MLEDLRNHDPLPSEEEREWMATDPVTVVLRGLAIASVAVMVGLTASYFLAGKPAFGDVAVNAQR
jgi:hypothetical protein